jgi:hypothetical protein
MRDCYPGHHTTQRIKDRIARSIGRRSAEVFLRPNFKGIRSHAQVGKALGALTCEGRSVRIGYGVTSESFLFLCLAAIHRAHQRRDPSKVQATRELTHASHLTQTPGCSRANRTLDEPTTERKFG